MGKIKSYSNYRVEVDVDTSWLSDDPARRHEQAMIRMRDLVSEIKRHVDNIGNIYEAYDTEEICGFCHRGWDTDLDGCPSCCDNAQEEWMEGVKVND